MIESAVADVVSPTITTDQPNAFLHQVIRKLIQTARFCRIDPGQLLAQGFYPITLSADSSFVALIGIKQLPGQKIADSGSQVLKQYSRRVDMRINRQAKTKTKFRVVFE